MAMDTIIRSFSKISYVVLYHIAPESILGPRAKFWNKSRRKFFPIFDKFFGSFLHICRPIRDTEFVGTVNMDIHKLEKVLWSKGFHRNPIAAVKTKGGRPEIGSWVYRETQDAERQLHIMLFNNKSGPGIDVYAHEEYSCLKPSVAVDHYYGINQNEELGVSLAEDMLPID